jgi:predicted O-methyltransferase YrrM
MINIPDDKCSGYGLIDLLKDKGNLIGLEIGCDKGNTTIKLLENLPNIFLHGIDPYENYIDWNSNKLFEREQVYVDFLKKIEKHKDRFVLHRKKSDDAFSFFEEKSIDFIFIDGLHTYEQVKKDCENFYPLLKDDGLFSGHDYNTINDVKKAVNEFAKGIGKRQLMLTDFDVWYFYK